MSLAAIPIPGPIKSIFTTFPLRTYDPVDIKDTALQNELNKRTFVFENGKNDISSEKSFTLLIKEKPIKWKQSPAYICMDPIELFLQLSLCHKNEITLPLTYQTNDSLKASSQKMMIVNRPNLPSLIIKNQMIYRDELLSNLKLRFVGIQSQLAQLLDTDLYPFFGNKPLTSNDFNRAKQTLLQFSKFVESDDYDKNSLDYLDMKLASYILTLLYSTQVSNDIKQFIKEKCPKLKISAITTLKQLNPKLQPY
ncbi:similar to Saccharomyces cerevisiae YHR083W SAM35 Essential component of the sorting and assembly machinery (SAM complex or TOB complex) of the mitochondrial outer membrane [Maudiozyma saulgeensis]|uniref:Similar to Saccharomyces cerevisiae YHR083W SAM35 Essential component of the sorting and assembly machinery (SAM complex or TOB complex) of the mitochondrial outer membrane n=1 Tax=Maudiozyma saulgeensis TaxID=1789683 RepID=A0A1X7QXL2_9SACH|nr:similar to Saccharomyces cerevisiae YHR083W SAM35 Essential component of the sorting and assembly machinery (SAM complex or TOB complex) of the mitochondrial outer membrane [Kazachstania saulgeensis]